MIELSCKASAKIFWISVESIPPSRPQRCKSHSPVDSDRFHSSLGVDLHHRHLVLPARNSQRSLSVC